MSDNVDRWDEIRTQAVRAGLQAGLEGLRRLPKADLARLGALVALPELRIVQSAVRSAWSTPGPAVRTVREDAATRTIEGLLAFGGPFEGGTDSYGTRFSARTDWGLDLHPAGLPVLWDHGFDEEIGLRPIGMTGPPASFRTTPDGIWVTAELSKRQKWYARIAELLDAAGVGLSQGSAEHSVRVDPKTREVLSWPLHEVSLTSTEANPYNRVRIVAS